MLIVADGGSSKTDWMVLLPDNTIQSFISPGLNPFFQSEKEILKTLNHSKALNALGDEVKEIHFFGAGCNSPDKREVVSNALSAKFKNTFISVESDLLGSALATCGNKPGLSCLLGTGSNISYFNGKEILEGAHGLGYILGDEGSGTYFGKKLITDFLYHLMPEDLHKAFNNTYQINKESVIKNMYQKPLPNYFLASHTAFMSDHINHPYIKNIINEGLEEFVTTHICTYQNYQELYCHFVGAVAYNFREPLLEICKNHRINVGKILENPIQELFSFVREQEGF